MKIQKLRSLTDLIISLKYLRPCYFFSLISAVDPVAVLGMDSIKYIKYGQFVQSNKVSSVLQF